MPVKKMKNVVETEGTFGTETEETHYVLRSPASELTAAANFEYLPYPGAPARVVHAGETFTPPDGWTRDKAYEEILVAAKSKHGKRYEPGIVFNYRGEFVNPGEKNPALRERREHRAILPLKES